MCRRRILQSDITVWRKPLSRVQRTSMPRRRKGNSSSRCRELSREGGSLTSTDAQRIKSDSESASGMKPPEYALLACGSFNPITNMHLRMFEIGRDHLMKVFKDCTVSRGLISPVSDGYGKQGLESSFHRLNMCRLGIKGNTWLEVSSWECGQEKWTPTVNVLKSTKAYLQSKGDSSKPVLLCGSDLLESFNKPGLWKSCDIETILKDFGIVVVCRPGFDSGEAIRSNEILRRLEENIHIVTDLISNDTSSTYVRQAIKNKQSIKYLTPDDVVQYIEDHGLYSTKESENRNSDKKLAPYHANSSCGETKFAS